MNDTKEGLKELNKICKMKQAKKSYEEFKQIADKFGVSVNELKKNIENLSKPDLSEYMEIDDVLKWLDNYKERPSFIPRLFSEYGMLKWNEAIDQAKETILNYDHHYTNPGKMKHELIDILINLKK